MKKIGIYVHIPFCKKKCKYCDFVSFEDTEFVESYVNEVQQNIEDIEKILFENKIGNLGDVEVDTIYFGGGTPSFIDSKYILKILDKIREKFKIVRNPEITIEVNPGTTNKEKLKNYFENGINRLSIGLQSTNDRLLKTIGRIHNFDEFLDTYKIARKIGFKNINVDLMLGLPNQSLADLEKSLNEVIKLNPEHISLYSLILEEDTVLKKEVEKEILKLPSEDEERKMYHKTKEILEKNGYIHYEISNFAKPNFYSHHNKNCWEQHEYLGFGVASHSYFNNVRFSYTKKLSKYIEIFSEQVYNKNVVVHEIQNQESKVREYIILGLRKIDGIDFVDFEKKFKLKFTEIFEKEILKLKKEGLVDVTSKKISLSKKGLDFANIVFEEFI